MTDKPVRRLAPRPLTPEAFSPFGEVIAPEAAREVERINEGHSLRRFDLARIDCNREGGRPAVSLMRTTPKPYPLTLTIMERHPLGSQAFIPLSRQPFLVVVAPAGPFDPERLEAFLAREGAGVNYTAGVWHHYSLALGKPSDFLVIDRAGPGANCEEATLDPAVVIDLEGTIL